ncbi:accessory gene regulator B family protein [Lysinibacillus sp. FSL K6-0232]|uniref:accessory gene regulator B family protein n=1 Tax=Lysinibacillus sp. FSL K6-0232 TaxID=2921425 RepID=UPI0030F7D077
MEFTAKEKMLVDYFEHRRSLTQLDKIKLVYGFRIVTSELKKFLVIYSIAIVFGLFWEMLLVQIGFLLVRQVAYGAHCPSFRTCLVVSSILFPFITWLAIALPITSFAVWGAFLLGAVILLLIGPVSSKKTKVRGEAHRTFLFKKLYRRLILLGILLLIFPTSISVFFVAGALKAVFLVIIAKLGGYH